MPKVSVIIPCYNQEKYIQQALNSVLYQTYQDWECIVINDGSIDKSEEKILEIVKKDNRFRYISIKNSGVCVARNIAINNATGKYIFPLDGDDYITENCIEKCVNVFENNKNIKLVRIGGQFFGDISEKIILQNYKFEELLKKNTIHNSSMFIKDDFVRVGGYRENMLYCNEDWDLWIAILSIYEDNQVFTIDEELFFYRYISNTRRKNLKIESRNKEMQNLMVYNNFEIYNKYYPNIYERIQRYDYQNRLLNKFFVKVIIKIYNMLHIFKQK